MQLGLGGLLIFFLITADTCNPTQLKKGSSPYNNVSNKPAEMAKDLSLRHKFNFFNSFIFRT